MKAEVTTLGLERIPGRCAHGFDLATQHPGLCACQVEQRPLGAITPAEWATFTAALSKVARGGEVHQRDMRPLIRGRIKPSHIGACYTRAIAMHLIREVRRERSNDVKGRNTNKDEPVYELRAA